MRMKVELPYVMFKNGGYHLLCTSHALSLSENRPVLLMCLTRHGNIQRKQDFFTSLTTMEAVTLKRGSRGILC
uniref:Uncharacterized protein n=1 Tax=Anguilla anguilla TaxID=7936 RepID=A0A0E9WWL4_ANGAN